MLFYILGIVGLVFIIGLIIFKLKSEYTLYGGKVDECVKRLEDKPYNFSEVEVLETLISENIKSHFYEKINIKEFEKSKQDIFEFHKKIIQIKKTIDTTIHENPKLKNLNEFQVIYSSFEKDYVYFISLCNYYNDSISVLNKMLHKFPTNLIGKLLGYKDKKFF
ncbi:MAG: LemA family protein [Bacilli bacterium]